MKKLVDQIFILNLMNLPVLLFCTANVVAKTTGGLIFANYVRTLRQLR